MSRTKTVLLLLSAFAVFFSLCFSCSLMLTSCEETVSESDVEGTDTGDVEEEEEEVWAEEVPLDVPEEVEEEDPYEGHEAWCEELVLPPCSSNEDCTPSRIGVDRRCITPFWYKPKENEKSGLCVPVYLGWTPRQEKEEMTRRKNRLREIVRDRCVPPSWWRTLKNDYGHVDCGRVPGRSRNLPTCLEKKYCDPDKLYTALAVVAKRESDWRHRKAHNLPRDVEASFDSWLRACARGYYEDNPHFGSCVKQGRWKAVGEKWKRWRTYGYFGQNSNYRVALVDDRAPPEILCHEIYGVEAYLRALRGAWHKYDRGLDCKDAQGRRYRRDLLKEKKQKRDKKLDTWPEKTWYTLHRAASSGALCPRDPRPEQEGVKTKRQYYGARMKKVGLDPDEIVTLEMLGKEIPQKTLHVHVRALSERLDVLYPQVVETGV